MLVIEDNITGEPMNVKDALERTQKAYNADLRKRIADRQQRAEKQVKEGAPVAALKQLKEAEALRDKIGDENTRELQDELSDQMLVLEEEIRKHAEAQNWVTQAQEQKDPIEIRRLLLKAKERYRNYPELDTRIDEVEQRIITSLVRDLKDDADKISTAVQSAKQQDLVNKVQAFKLLDEAEAQCHTGLRRADAYALNPTRADYISRFKTLEDLQPQIQRERRDMQTLFEQLRQIDAAIEARDLRLVDNLLPTLIHKLPDDMRVIARTSRLATLKGADDLIKDALIHFNQQRYEACITQCNEIEKQRNPAYTTEALHLRRRAEVRLWLNQAKQKRAQGIFDQAMGLCKGIESQRTALPSEDHYLVDEAIQLSKEIENDQQVSRKTLDSLGVLDRYRTQGDWEEWAKQIKKLLEQASGAALSTIQSVWEKGQVEWLKWGKEEASKLNQAQRFSRAFEILHPLVNYNLLYERDDLYVAAAYQHYVSRATTLLEGRNEKEWTEAEQCAREASKLAPEHKGPEARRFEYSTMHTTLIKRAAILAGTGHAPTAAFDLVRSKMEEYPELGRDAELHTKLIGYGLEIGRQSADANGFARVLDQAKVMANVEGERENAAEWQALVNAAMQAHHGRYDEALTYLGVVRDRSASGAERHRRIRAVYVQVQDIILSGLRQQLQNMPLNARGDALLQRVKVLSWIQQLDPKDLPVANEIKTLEPQLNALIRDLRRRSDALELSSNLAESLTNGETLQADLLAVQRALQNMNNPLAVQLKNPLDATTKAVELWRTTQAGLDAIDLDWTRLLRGGWIIKNTFDKLRERLSGIEHELSASLEVTEVYERKDRFERLQGWIDGKSSSYGSGSRAINLMSVRPQLEKAWQDEDFDKVESLLTLLESTELKVKRESDLGEFKIPDSWFRLDEFFPTQRVVSGAKQLRERVRSKKDNLKVWQKWHDDFGAQFDTVDHGLTAAQEKLNATPPCYTDANKLFTDLDRSMTELEKKLSKMPDTLESKKAADLSEEFEPDTTADTLKEMKEEVAIALDKTSAGIEMAMPIVNNIKSILAQINERKRKLDHPNTRADLQKQADLLKQKDACHPMITHVAELLKLVKR